MKEERVVSTPPPKLCLNSSISSSKRTVQPESWSTPPIQVPGAVPFGWEEAPGKPKQHNRSNAQILPAEFHSEDERRLELPPRLSLSASERRASCRRFTYSPTSVLDGPYSFIRRAASLRFGKKASSNSTDKYWDVGEETYAPTMSLHSFSSSSSSKLSNLSADETREESDGDERKVRILRYTKKKPVSCIASSHFLGGVLGKMKRAMVPYGRDQSER